MGNWYTRARGFILTQQQEQLKRSIGRYPDSPELPRRVRELQEIETELKELESQQLSSE